MYSEDDDVTVGAEESGETRVRWNLVVVSVPSV